MRWAVIGRNEYVKKEGGEDEEEEVEEEKRPPRHTQILNAKLPGVLHVYNGFR